jgi:hypothetical protein
MILYVISLMKNLGWRLRNKGEKNEIRLEKK